MHRKVFPSKRDDWSLPFAKPWSIEHLKLTKDMHTECFDIVDTSNVVGHLGLVNMLIAAQPLLSSIAISVLYTETLLRALETKTSPLDSCISGSSLILQLFRIIPVEYLLGSPLDQFSLTVLHIHTKSANSVADTLRLLWKFPSLEDSVMVVMAASERVQIDHQQLANAISPIYNPIFIQEDITKMYARMERLCRKPISNDANHYTRASITGIIRLPKR